MAGVSVGVRCPLMHSTTKGRGAASEGDCVCRAGYFNDGGSCEPCEAAGTNCTEEGVAIASLPLLPDWWRLPNSTQLQRCFPISNCTGGTNASALCGEGYERHLLYPACTPLRPSCQPYASNLSPHAPRYEGAFCGVCSKESNGTRYHRSVGQRSLLNAASWWRHSSAAWPP